MLSLQDAGAELSTKHNSKAAKVSGIGKDPSTHTAFLPDKEREQQEQHLREQLKQEYELRQQVCIVQHTSIHSSCLLLQWPAAPAHLLRHAWHASDCPVCDGHLWMPIDVCLGWQTGSEE